MKIEVGKFYKTRSGRKVKIYSTHGNLHQMVHGAILDEGFWELEWWDQNGSYMVDNKSEGRLDIVDIWTEMGDGKLGL